MDFEGMTPQQAAGVLVDFTGMTPQQAAGAITERCEHLFASKNLGPTIESMIRKAMVSNACTHFFWLGRATNHQAAVKDFMVKFGQYRQDWCCTGWS